MTACREMTRRHRSPSQAPLDDDDLLSEILLRLPPQPSSLPRVSLVSKRWRDIAADPGFLRRFRAHHRRSPPLLGCFVEVANAFSFVPTLEPPNRVPPRRFSLRFDEDDDCIKLLNCRHGILLISDETEPQFVVWDPVTGDQRHLAIPSGFDPETTEINGAVLRAAGDVQPFQFQVVLVAKGNNEDIAIACVYSSETGLWGDLITTPLLSSLFGATISMKQPVLVGDTLYWLLLGDGSNFDGILEFDCEKHNLAVIPAPMDVHAEKSTVIRADSGGLGFLHILNFTAQFWERKIDCDSVASWGLRRTIELDQLLSLNSKDTWYPCLVGFAEDNNVVFLRTMVGLFTVQLQSLQFKNLPQTNITPYCHPFESVYTAAIKMISWIWPETPQFGKPNP